MDANASYTFGKKLKTTFYAEANNLLNQPLRYYQGTKDRTMQSEHYGIKVNAGVKSISNHLSNNQKYHNEKVFSLLLVILLSNWAVAQITDYSIFDKKFNFM